MSFLCTSEHGPFLFFLSLCAFYFFSCLTALASSFQVLGYSQSLTTKDVLATLFFRCCSSVPSLVNSLVKSFYHDWVLDIVRYFLYISNWFYGLFSLNYDFLF